MITPHKYLNLDLSLLNMGGIILNVLKNENIIKYDELLDKVISFRGKSAADVFVPALSFLFLLGKIEYKKDLDIIEFIQ